MARTRRQLAEAAAQLFLDRGYAAVTVEDIVAAVEVSPRTFFRYFSSKEDVLDEILMNEAEAVTAALRERPEDEPILDALREAASSWVSATQRDPRLKESLARAPARLPGSLGGGSCRAPPR
jgi:AcrR family transcriptional regulator